MHYRLFNCSMCPEILTAKLRSDPRMWSRHGGITCPLHVIRMCLSSCSYILQQCVTRYTLELNIEQETLTNLIRVPKRPFGLVVRLWRDVLRNGITNQFSNRWITYTSGRPLCPCESKLPIGSNCRSKIDLTNHTDYSGSCAIVSFSQPICRGQTAPVDYYLQISSRLRLLG